MLIDVDREVDIQRVLNWAGEVIYENSPNVSEARSTLMRWMRAHFGDDTVIGVIHPDSIITMYDTKARVYLCSCESFIEGGGGCDHGSALYDMVVYRETNRDAFPDSVVRMIGNWNGKSEESQRRRTW